MNDGNLVEYWQTAYIAKRRVGDRTVSAAEIWVLYILGWLKTRGCKVMASLVLLKSYYRFFSSILNRAGNFTHQQNTALYLLYSSNSMKWKHPCINIVYNIYLYNISEKVLAKSIVTSVVKTSYVWLSYIHGCCILLDMHFNIKFT